MTSQKKRFPIKNPIFVPGIETMPVRNPFGILQNDSGKYLTDKDELHNVTPVSSDQQESKRRRTIFYIERRA